MSQVLTPPEPLLLTKQEGEPAPSARPQPHSVESAFADSTPENQSQGQGAEEPSAPNPITCGTWKCLLDHLGI